MPEFVEEANLMSVNLPNTYAGGFVNTTYNPPQEACIVLVLQRSQGTDVTGKLTIYGDWIGGSEFIGAISGTRITFPTHGAAGKVTITWTGEIAGDSIAGDYTVTDRRFLMGILGMRNQAGLWSVQKSGAEPG